MSDFICTTCGKRVQRDESFAGKLVHCPVCYAAITVPPRSVNDSPALAIATPEDAPQARIAMPAAASNGSFSEGLPPLPEAPPSIRKESPHIVMRLLIPVLVIICIIAIVVAMLFPAVEKVREAAARTQSISNLKQISLATAAFHDVHKRLPFNGTKDAVPGDPTSGSWGFQILPFIDQTEAFNKADRKAEWWCYTCPGRGRPRMETSNGGGMWTDYFFNNYLNDPLQAIKADAKDMRRMFVDITDGVSNTILVGHGNIDTTQYGSSEKVTLSVNVFTGGTTGTMRSGNNTTEKRPGNPGGATLQRDSDQAPMIGSWGGPFPQGGLMGMGDGSVHMFAYTTTNFSAFLTPTGRELAIDFSSPQ